MRTILSLIYCIIFSIPLFPEPKKEIYEIVNFETLNSLQYTDSDANDDVENKIEKTISILNEYHSQFPEDRRTMAERSRSGEFRDISGEVKKTYKENSGYLLPNVNAVRLLRAEKENRLSSSGIAVDSNTFYKLYANLGFLYYKKNDYPGALNSFNASLRFHDFSQSEDTLFLEIDSKENISTDRKEKIREHNKTLISLREKEGEIQKNIDDYHLNAADAARRGKPIPDEKSFRSQIEEDTGELENLRKNYEKSLNSVFRDLQEDKGKYDAKVLKTIALILKKLETAEKIKSRLKGGFLLQDPEKETGFIGFTELMELSSRLYSGDSSVFKYLGDEYKSRGQIQKSIDSYHKFLSTPDKKENEEDAAVSLALAGLYASNRNYIQSIEFYNKYLEKNQEVGARQDVIFALGDIYFKRLGNYSEAEIQFEKYLKESGAAVLSNDELSNVKLLRKKMQSEFALAKIKKTQLRREAEDEYLKKALETFEKIKEEENKFLTRLETQKESVRLLKIKSREQTESPDPLPDEILKLKELEEIQKQLGVVLQSLPTIELFYQAAETFENRRDFDMSLKYYRGIQEKGIASDRQIALQNILRIQKILKDGIYRERIPR